MQEVTRLVPKPMMEIGPYPILWHIMKIYAHYGVNEFCVGLGYRSEVIKEYFSNYRLRANSASVHLGTGRLEIEAEDSVDWTVRLIETGAHTQTGGRVARMQKYIGNSTFFLTYGDGVANVDIRALLDFHQAHGKIGTVCAVRPPSRFGALNMGEGDLVTAFTEKPHSGETWINGGFFVFEPEFFEYLSTDESCILERAPLERLAADGQLAAYRHPDFWQCIDTVRDIEQINTLWDKGKAPWKVWS